jgi:hypothetical protein
MNARFDSDPSNKCSQGNISNKQISNNTQSISDNCFETLKNIELNTVSHYSNAKPNLKSDQDGTTEDEELEEEVEDVLERSGSFLQKMSVQNISKISIVVRWN